MNILASLGTLEKKNNNSSKCCRKEFGDISKLFSGIYPILLNSLSHLLIQVGPLHTGSESEIIGLMGNKPLGLNQQSSVTYRASLLLGGCPSVSKAWKAFQRP